MSCVLFKLLMLWSAKSTKVELANCWLGRFLPDLLSSIFVLGKDEVRQARITLARDMPVVGFVEEGGWRMLVRFYRFQTCFVCILFFSSFKKTIFFFFC